jgi:sugar O-acyltransferase (sialic acid O-acetyltransferase NeuD family)
MKPVYLYGAGGHAKVILDMLEEEGRSVQCVFDDNPDLRLFLGYPVRPWVSGGAPEMEGIISIGDNQTRREIAARTNGPFMRIAHRNSYLSSRAAWGEGTVLMSGTSLHSGAILGAHCIVNTHASVDHDCWTGDFVHIGPHAVLCGHVEIGEGTLVGAGSVIVPGIKVGRWALIGAGAVIRRDVPDGATVVGNPGRIFFQKNI